MSGEVQADSTTFNWRWTSIDQLLILGFTLAATVLFTLKLGSMPLKDWDEGLVAQVAREIWQAPVGSMTWLHPTLWGEPYFNKPPLMHWLIAAMYAIGGVNEWTARLPSTMLTALSVPLFYGVARAVFHLRLPALFATVVYLTSLPVVRNGRFAMLDGAILCFFLLLMWCLLQARRNYQYLLGVGLAAGLLCLTKGLLVAVLLGSIGLLFLAWDTPRLLKQPYLWIGIALGIVPAAAWYVAQAFYYGQTFLGNNLVEQSLQRIWTDVEDNGAPPWYYLLEILKYGAPWVLFLPLGCRRAWTNRNLSWAKLAIVWGGVYLVTISVMATKLPWYVLPVFPALALVVGAELAALWQQGKHSGIKQPPTSVYSRFWRYVFGTLAVGSGIGAGFFLTKYAPPQFDLAILLTVVSGTMLVAAWLVAQQNPSFIAVLAWGTYLALLLLLLSPHWAWELAEAYPVQPVADLIKTHSPDHQEIYTSYPYHRPSLNFYSQHRVIPASQQQLRRLWRREPTAYLLIDRPTLSALNIPPGRVVGTTDTWLLVTKNRG